MFDLEKVVAEFTGADSCQLGSIIQKLWSNYGVIQRAELVNHEFSKVIVKHIDLSDARENRRGWGGQISHQRKVNSYEVEINFYQNYSMRCSNQVRVPQLLGSLEKPGGAGYIIVLEDLDAAGFDQRKNTVSDREVVACLQWLAEFHATFLNTPPDGLWPIGTYWHLATRPEEWQAMAPGPLKDSARQIDKRLNSAQHQTLVHGDAKLANFCFSNKTETNAVAAVDFQYVGGGAGIKDVAYLLSCLGPQQINQKQDAFLDTYFHELQTSIASKHSNVDFEELQSEWRELYCFAWADFHRFLAGWSPGHWKMNDEVDLLTKKALQTLQTPN